MTDYEHEKHLQRHEAELTALKHICTLQGRYTEQEKVLHAVLEVLETALGFMRPTIMLLSPNGDELLFEASSQPPVQTEEQRYLKGEGVTGQVLQTGEATLIPNIGKEPLFRDRVHHRGQSMRDQLSFICAPIRIENDIIGTISTDFPETDLEQLNEALRVLEIVSNLIANDVRARRKAQQQQLVLREENARLRRQLGQIRQPENIIGNSDEMAAVYVKINQVATSDTTVLVRGESGTGKELAASAIHYASPRADGPFVKVNCAALSEALLESELFGHEKGAFTGATTTRVGRIEQAENGTLFLDEIGDFSPVVQVKLLRVLQEKEFERVGSNHTRRIDARLIAATNRDLETACADGSFREDLYYRINVFPVDLPPLRKRRSDILQLANHFAQSYATKMGKQINRISTNAINMLLAYHWPGNVRELENCIEYAVVLTTDNVIHGHSLPPTLQVPDSNVMPVHGTLKDRVQSLEKDLVMDALKRHDGNINDAASDLGLSSRMVRYKIENLAIDYQKYFKRKRKR